MQTGQTNKLNQVSIIRVESTLPPPHDLSSLPTPLPSNLRNSQAPIHEKNDQSQPSSYPHPFPANTSPCAYHHPKQHYTTG
mmetsp:Transcript_10612/g.22614  ORF Transcript_10612/g.22614 Transcript_10612/m.22614 type:complete len:81 (-) Transcript_10612:827-1069(-)